MSTETTEQTTPKTAAEAWAAIHKACGNAVRAQLEDDDVDGAIWYAKKMAKAEARLPAKPTDGVSETENEIALNFYSVVGEQPTLNFFELSEAEEYALGHRDSKIVHNFSPNAKLERVLK